jgi:RNA polymerase sigma-70 factor (ECF subfamily)
MATGSRSLEAGEEGEAMGDGATVQQILNGDQVAGERVVTEQYPRIYRLLRHLTGAVEVAEDLTQQTFLKAWQALASFRGEASLGTWLHRIAYHEYTHWLRARREHAPLEEAGDLPDRQAERGLEALLLQDALDRLSPEHREAFLLYHVQGLSVPEVAAVMEVPPGTVKSRLFHARQRLRELLAEHVGETERSDGTPEGSGPFPAASCACDTRGGDQP